MSIIEFQGGKITHRYLMTKSKSDLSRMYLELLRIRERELADAGRIDFLAEQTVASYSGISMDKIPSVDGEPSGFRFMRRLFIGDAKNDFRAAIDHGIQMQGTFR